MGLFGNIANAVKTGVSDALAVGQQVVGTVFDVGSKALGGVKTLVTDPKKFVEDSAHIVTGAVKHAANSLQDGASMIGEGWNEAWATGNPGMFLWKAAGGTIQMASLGVSDMIKEHVESVSEVTRDELGNMTGFEISEDCDAITRIALQRGGKTISTVVNADEEVKEAIAEGDVDRANKVFGDMATSTVVKPLSKAAAVGAAAVMVTATGGAAAPFIAGGLGIASGIGDMYANKKMSDFDIDNATDDVKDRVDDEIRQLTEAGKLDEAGAAKYREIMTPYYQNAAYTNYGNDLGSAYLGEGASNSDFKKQLLMAAGLPEADKASVQVAPGAAEAVQSVERSSGDEAVLAALAGFSDADKTRFAQALAAQIQSAQAGQYVPEPAGYLEGSVSERDAQEAGNAEAQAEQPGAQETSEQEYQEAMEQYAGLG